MTVSQAGRRHVPLGSVATIERTSVKPNDIPSGTRYVGLEHLDAEAGTAEHVPVKAGELRSSKFRFTDKHLLFGKLRPYLRKVACPGFDGICSTDILPILPGPDIDPRYLYHWLRNPHTTNLATARSEGVNLPRVSPKTLLQFRVPLPPLSEQRRIAAMLDKAEAVRRKRREVVGLLDELLRSVFLEMFGEPVRNQKGWDLVRLGDMATVRRGASPRPINEYVGGSVPWIKIGDATRSEGLYITSTEECVTQAGAAKSVFLQSGSIVVANSGVSLGFARILQIGGCIHDGWLSIEDLDNRVDKVYLVSMINSLTSRFRRTAPSGTQPNLNTSIMRALDVPVPPAALQAHYKRLLDRADEFSRRQDNAMMEADSLFNALAQRSFGPSKVGP